MRPRPVPEYSLVLVHFQELTELLIECLGRLAMDADLGDGSQDSKSLHRLRFDAMIAFGQMVHAVPRDLGAELTAQEISRIMIERAPLAIEVIDLNDELELVRSHHRRILELLEGRASRTVAELNVSASVALDRMERWLAGHSDFAAWPIRENELGELETSRLRVGPIARTDAPDIFTLIANDSRLFAHQKGVAPPDLFCLEYLLARRVRGGTRDGHAIWLTLLAREAHTNDPVVWLHVTLARELTTATIGELATFGSHRRRGYAFEVLRAIIRALFWRYPTLTEIAASLDTENLAARALYARAGFSEVRIRRHADFDHGSAREIVDLALKRPTLLLV
jgi:RimJ/RimL family protein N-acetyltransferase